ncbi:uncharacterized protein DSM5745_04069 [Aspergillus mulundensis]|uniref:Uncharacterized protein n=1 Tax=Aspergillus mulundensis TaxID=1810919 RepID=A0A3D8SBU0_9EURO|nr:hypothetical protein DSM5745_04069 [Aspergillus mulundensis]RDW83743.1 hypothetical protein DSM5745_04069 [Aspergillus mulundensis]
MSSSSDSDQTLPIDTLVKPGYHERIVLEIDRRDPDMMSLVVVSRTVLAHSIDVVDLADHQVQLQEPGSTDSTNGSGNGNSDISDTSNTEGEGEATTAESTPKRTRWGKSDNTRAVEKSKKRICTSGSAVAIKKTKSVLIRER